MINRFVRIIVGSIKLIPGVLRLATICERRWPELWKSLLGVIEPAQPQSTTAKVQPPFAGNDVATRRFRRQLELEMSRRRSAGT